MTPDSVRVRIEGSGVAAAALAVLLARRGFGVAHDLVVATGERIVAIPEDTVDLLRALFGFNLRQRIAARAVTGRRVAWEEAAFTDVESPGLVCDVGDVVRCLRETLPAATEGVASHEAEWRVVAHGRSTAEPALAAGRRVAAVGAIASLPAFDMSKTLIAAVHDGWLFACPHPASGVALTWVTPPEHVEDSTVATAVDALWPGHGALVRVSAHRVPTAPCFDAQCAAPGRLLVGDTVLAIDPLRGDGVGFALRGALLAQSVLTAIAQGGDAARYLAHYRARLARAFRRHVEECIAHYARASNANVWQAEIARMTKSLAELPDEAALQYRLEGLDLAPA